MNIPDQQAPFTVQLEFVEGCNLKCGFCGLRGMDTSAKKFVEPKTIERICKEIKRVGWNCKIVIGMHGEPTLHPKFSELVNIIRKYLPKQKVHMFTNGFGIVHNVNAVNTKRTKEAIYMSLLTLRTFGIDLCLDYYKDDGDWYDIAEQALQNDLNIVELEKGVPLFNDKKEWRIVVLPPIKDDGENSMTRNLANHSGAAFPPDYSYNNKRCTMPFRELSFRWDGNVALCCDDFRGRYPIGNINDMSIEELWQHERFQAARIMLYNYNRNFEPCNGCTNISMRVGFLPDSSGQDSLPEITPDVRKISVNVSKENKPLAIIVKRKWEV